MGMDDSEQQGNNSEAWYLVASKVIVTLRKLHRKTMKFLVRSPWLTRSRLLASLGPEIPFGLYEMDRKLEPYLNYKNGYFVEAGAYDGIRASNTKSLELYRGWRGVLVEPLPIPFTKLRANRSSRNSLFQKALVPFGFEEPTVKLLSAGLMSTVPSPNNHLVDAREHARSGMQFIGGGEVHELRVPAAPLNEILREAKAPAQIDFLSLDIEGNELGALQGIDHSEFRFRFILVEVWDRGKILDFLLSVDYCVIEDFGSDLLFADNRLAGSTASPKT